MGNGNAQASRSVALDALRGAAIVWMVAFHLAFDLNHFGWIEPRQQFLSDPFWTWQRVCIVSLFMFCAGAGQACAARAGVGWSRFARRWLQVAACAALVSAATWIVFPRTWISFGVLHGLAVMVLLARLSADWPRPVLLALAVLAILLPHGFSHPLFDQRWLQGVGLVTHKPVTEDYAPVLPWMGAVWLGLAWGPGLMARAESALRDRAFGRPLHLLALIGRWPLTIYMVHQPVFWGALLLIGPTMRG